jgi:hypothetical protein
MIEQSHRYYELHFWLQAISISRAVPHRWAISECISIAAASGSAAWRIALPVIRSFVKYILQTEIILLEEINNVKVTNLKIYFVD